MAVFIVVQSLRYYLAREKNRFVPDSFGNGQSGRENCAKAQAPRVPRCAELKHLAFCFASRECRRLEPQGPLISPLSRLLSEEDGVVLICKFLLT